MACFPEAPHQDGFDFRMGKADGEKPAKFFGAAFVGVGAEEALCDFDGEVELGEAVECFLDALWGGGAAT